MAGNTNATDRLPSRIGVETFEIFTIDDFPDPVAGVITLPNGVYVIASNVTLSERFELAPGATVEFISAGVGKVLTYTGSATMFTSTGSVLLLMQRINIVLVGAGAQVFDLDGPSLVVETSALAAFAANITVGAATNVDTVVSFSRVNVIGFAGGLELTNAPRVILDADFFTTSQTGLSPVLNIGSGCPTVLVDNIVFNAGIGEELFYLEPATVRSGGGQFVSLQRITNDNGSAFFAAGSLDETDPRVFVTTSPPQKPSFNLAGCYVNGNVTPTPAITTGVFQDMAFGTIGTAMIVTTTTELWELIDEVNCTWRYAGAFPFYGFAVLDLTATVMGGNSVFPFKLVKDSGAGFVDLPDPIEGALSLLNTGGSSSKTFPLVCQPGDEVKPQVTRATGGGAVITFTHAAFTAADS